MNRWLFKTEPSVFSWDDLVAKGDAGEEWDGVRNRQAQAIMGRMAVGDRGFLYHSQAEKAVIGIVEVAAAAHPDSTDPAWSCVDIRAVEPLTHPVTLAQVKAEPDLSDTPLVRQPRLSVQPVSDLAWDRIRALGGVST